MKEGISFYRYGKRTKKIANRDKNKRENMVKKRNIVYNIYRKER